GLQLQFRIIHQIIDFRFHQRSSHSSAVKNQRDAEKSEKEDQVGFKNVSCCRLIRSYPVFPPFLRSIKVFIYFCAPAAKGFFRLSTFGHRENVIEAVERIKKNLE